TYYSDEELREAGVGAEMLKNGNYVKAGSVIEGLEEFDAEFFGYSPGDAEIMDPQIRIFEECVWEALEDAGYDPGRYEGKIGLFAGASANLNWQYMAYMKAERDPSSRFNNQILSDKDFLATQVSYKLNLNGPSLNIITACSTSLVAINDAIKSI